MTSIILFEGIPTSGKSYLQKLVGEILSWEKKSVELITDKEVNTPFARKSNRKDYTAAIDAPEYLLDLLKNKVKKSKDYVLSHNMHLFYLTTNNSRGQKETIEKTYAQVEELLEIYPSLIVFLEIEHRYILSSFHKRFARNHLLGKVDPFKSFLDAKGTEFEQLAYYQKKQNMYKEFLKKSKVHSLHIIIKRSSDYKEIANQIVRKIHEIEGGWHIKG